MSITTAASVMIDEQLQSDLRTLTGFPHDLALSFSDPRLRYAEVQVDVDDWEEAKAAADRVRALLLGEARA